MKKKFVYTFSIFLTWSIVLFVFFSLFQKHNNETLNNLNIDSSFVQDLYKTIIPNNDFYILNQFYSNDELTNEYKINLGIMNFVYNNPQLNTSRISAEKIEESIKKILGENVTMEHQTLKFMINGYCGYEYNELTNQYESFDGCGGIPNEYFYRQLISAEESDNKIILTEQSFYVFVSRNEEANNIYVYNNCNQEKMLDYIENNDGTFYEIDEKKYMDKGSIYKYVFYKENGHYIFQKILKED